jgi:hypothetical protein
MDRRNFLTFLGIAAAQVYFEIRPYNVLAASTDPPHWMRPEHFKRFAPGEPAKLIDAKNFDSFIGSRFPSVVCPFARGLSLYESIRSWSSAGSVSIEHHRYLFVQGYMQRVWNNRALLWMDTSSRFGGSKPLTLACFLTFNTATSGIAGDASRSLWIFSNQSVSSWDRGAAPNHFRLTLDRWLRSRKPRRQDRGFVGHVIISEPAGPAIGETPGDFGIRPYRLSANSEVLHWTSQGMQS